jgi:stage II sporulation protein D
MYRLVIGRYADQGQAEADAESIRQRGLKAYVKPDGDGILVRVDGFREAAWAQTLQRRVASAGYRDCRVETYAPLRRSAYLSVTVGGTEVPATDLHEIKVGAGPPCQPSTTGAGPPCQPSATLGQPSTTGSLLTVEIPPAAACPYRGALAVRVGPAGRLVVINEVLLDDYLRGVLPLEMDPDFDIEALQAQAVAARTYALTLLAADYRSPDSQFAIRNSQFANSEGYHFAVQNTQAYGGVRAETARTDACVAATRGEVLTFEGSLVNAFFHTVCGGQTEDVINVWGMDAPCLTGVRDGPNPLDNLATPEGIANFLNSHSDSYCRDSPDYRWTVSFSRAQLQVLLERTLPRVLERKDIALGPLEDLRVEERSPNGRVLALAVVGRDHTYVVRRDAIRWLFGTGYAGTAGLKSTLFVIQRSADGSRYTFLGGGWGHGAGLCQQGAQGLARAGRTYEEILRHYYPGAVLTKVQ